MYAQLLVSFCRIWGYTEKPNHLDKNYDKKQRYIIKRGNMHLFKQLGIV